MFKNSYLKKYFYVLFFNDIMQQKVNNLHLLLQLYIHDN